MGDSEQRKALEERSREGAPPVRMVFTIDGKPVHSDVVEGTTNSAGKYTPASPSPSHRVIQAKTANELLRIMQQVPGIDAEGAQPWGVIPGYAVAAKTGVPFD